MNTLQETSALLSLVVRALVHNRDAVSVGTFPQESGGAVFRVSVDPGETAMLIGSHGRIARSLRTIIHSTSVATNSGPYSIEIAAEL